MSRKRGMEIIAILEKQGWTVRRHTGTNHVQMQHPDSPKLLLVGMGAKENRGGENTLALAARLIKGGSRVS